MSQAPTQAQLTEATDSALAIERAGWQATIDGLTTQNAAYLASFTTIGASVDSALATANGILATLPQLQALVDALTAIKNSLPSA